MQQFITPAAKRQDGFTVVELMIATLVSSIILLVITYGVVHFTNTYYKGINSSATQAVAQAASDAVSQSIQFNATGTVSPSLIPATANDYIFCAGTQIFLYTPGVKLTAAPGPGAWGLYELDNPSANCTLPGSTTGGTELLGSNMRLSDISLSPVGASNVWQLSLRIAYGDPDLLCRTSIAGVAKGSCAVGATSYTAADLITGNDVTCKSQTGSQFCSVAQLNTAIGQRIT